VKEAARQATEWTPENIQKDPVGYLTWALEQCEKSEQKLAASKLSLKSKKNQIDRSLTANQAELSDYSKLLQEAKAVYKEAKAENKWPASLRGRSFEEAALKGKIVEAHDKVKNLEGLVQTYSQSQAVIDRRLTEIEQKVTEVNKLRNKLSTDLEVAKVKQSVEGIGEISDKLGAIMDTTSALVSSSAEATSLEDLVKPTGQQRVDNEFDKIMGE
jgi:DNA repair exonuclease SbcCD ATPase subunit